MNLSDDEMTERINLLTVSCDFNKEKDLKLLNYKYRTGQVWANDETFSPKIFVSVPTVPGLFPIRHKSQVVSDFPEIFSR